MAKEFMAAAPFCFESIKRRMCGCKCGASLEWPRATKVSAANNGSLKLESINSKLRKEKLKFTVFGFNMHLAGNANHLLD